MSVRYIYNTSGEYVAFISGKYLFSLDCEWLGAVANGNEVYNTDGLLIGYVLDDDRIVRDKRMTIPKRIARPARPPRPARPARPLRRLRMTRLLYPYEDIFERGISTKKLIPPYELGQFDRLLGASIIAHDGAPLGIISKDKYASDSISNSYGPYGSEYSATSIFNKYGKYGGEYSALSPFNKYTSTPPKVIRDGTFLGYLTANEYLPNRIDANEFAAWLNTGF